MAEVAHMRPAMEIDTVLLQVVIALEVRRDVLGERVEWQLAYDTQVNDVPDWYAQMSWQAACAG